MNSTVRLAGPEDRDLIVGLHREAFAGSMGASLGQTYLRSFVGGFFDEPAFALLAELGSRTVGYVMARPAAFSGGLRLAPAVALAVIRRPKLLRRSDIRTELRRQVTRLRKPSTPPRSPEPTTVSLTAIGVIESARRSGVATALLDSYESEARKREFREGRLTVYRSNEPARLAYERAGWQEAEPSESDATLVYRKSFGVTGDG